MASKKKKGKSNDLGFADPRFRWVTHVTEEVPPGPQGQPAHPAGSVLTMLQIVSVEGLGRVGFPAPRPSALLLEKAKSTIKRATKLRAGLDQQTSSKGFIKPMVDRSVTNIDPWYQFFEEAMAGVLLIHAALDNYANEALPDDFEYTEKNQTLSRRQIQDGMGIEKRLSRVLSQALNKPNLMTAKTDLWECLTELKALRDDIQHMSFEDAYSQDGEGTVWSRLLSADLSAFVACAEEAMQHYGFKTPRSVKDIPGDDNQDD